MLAYRGPPIPLHGLVFGGSHSLYAQSFRPRELLTGHVNADGVGVVWFRDGSPVAIHDPRPVWQVTHLPGLLESVRATTMLAAVRNVSPGVAADPSGIPPLVRGPVVLVLNGFLEDYRGSFLRPALDACSDDALGLLGGLSDTELIAVEVADRLTREGGLAYAVMATARRVLEHARAVRRTAQLTLLASDGRAVVALRAGTGSASNGLYLGAGTDLAPGGRILASEPLDDGPGWNEVPDGALVDLESGRIQPLEP